MFKLPMDFDIGDFVGKHLTEVGVGIGTVALNFTKPAPPGLESKSCVTLHGNYSCYITGSEHLGRASEPATATELTAFLNFEVTDFNVDDHFALRICFGQVGEIRVAQDPDEFESFAIRVPGKLEIVGP
jgi:hypothetical protein